MDSVSPQTSSEISEWVSAAALRLEDKVIAWRRDIHEHPELSYNETRTAALVAKDASAPNRIAASIFSLATSMPTTTCFCVILHIPSLLVRALGPMQLFGFGKTPDLALAPLQASCLGDLRAQTWRRAVVGSSRPFAHSAKANGHKGPSLSNWPQIVEARSLHYALRAPVGTTSTTEQSRQTTPPGPRTRPCCRPGSRS